MDLKDKIVECWQDCSEGFDSYIKHDLTTFRAKAWTNLLLKNETHRLNVLDIGTGPGFFSIIFAKNGHKVTGIDCSKAMIEKAAANCKREKVDAQFLVMDSHKPEFADNSFDMIVNRNVTWTLYDAQEAYKEWYRVLKPHGKLMIFDANWYTYLYDSALKAKVLQAEHAYRKKYREEPFCSSKEPKPDAYYAALPMSRRSRPSWDIEMLKQLGYHTIQVDWNIIDKVYDEKEMMLYGYAPLFKLTALK